MFSICPTEPKCNSNGSFFGWFRYSLLKQRSFFIQDVEGSFFVFNFFYIDFRRGGLDCIDCKY